MKRTLPALVVALFAWTSSTMISSAQNQGGGGGGSGGSGASKSGAANKVSDEETKDHFWDCTLPGGNFCITLGKITSVSLHQYIVKSPSQSPTAVPMPSRVYEVNIATDAALVTRFYYIEAAVDGGAANTVKTGLDRLNDVASQAAERTGNVKFWQQVQKDYPTTTHAHTIEYRLDSMDDLNRLYGSVKRSWLLGKGARFTITNE